MTTTNFNTLQPRYDRILMRSRPKGLGPTKSCFSLLVCLGALLAGCGGGSRSTTLPLVTAPFPATTATPSSITASVTTTASSTTSAHVTTVSPKALVGNYRFHMTENQSGWEWDGQLSLEYSLTFGKDVSKSPPGKGRLVTNLTSTWSSKFVGTQAGRVPPFVVPVGLLAYAAQDAYKVGSTSLCFKTTIELPQIIGFQGGTTCRVGYNGESPTQTASETSDGEVVESDLDKFLSEYSSISPGAYRLELKIAKEAGFDYTLCRLILFPDGRVVNETPKGCTTT
jgi:hypothetical protein